MNDNFYILLVAGITGIGMIIISFIMLQVRNQDRLLKQQKKLDAATILHQKTLLEAVITSQETERQRIGSDLHDEVGAVLSSLRMFIEKYGESGSAATAPFADQCKGIIDHVIGSVRQIGHNLSPHITGRHGFHDAIHELCDTVNLAGTPRLALDFNENDVPLHLPANTCIALFRILAELINNTIKHGCAGNISIKIRTVSGVLQISYSDDGIGFTYPLYAAGTGMGLQNIESRLTMIHATWTIRTAEKEGFNMDIKIKAEIKTETL